MNRQQTHRQLLIRDPAYRRAFQRLDEALEREPDLSPRERIQQIYGLVPLDYENPPEASEESDPA